MRAALSAVITVLIGLFGGALGWFVYNTASIAIHHLDHPTPEIHVCFITLAGYTDFVTFAVFIAVMGDCVRRLSGRLAAVLLVILPSPVIAVAIVLINGSFFIVPALIGGFFMGGVLALHCGQIGELPGVTTRRPLHFNFRTCLVIFAGCVIMSAWLAYRSLHVDDDEPFVNLDRGDVVALLACSQILLASLAVLLAVFAASALLRSKAGTSLSNGLTPEPTLRSRLRPYLVPTLLLVPLIGLIEWKAARVSQQKQIVRGLGAKGYFEYGNMVKLVFNDEMQADADFACLKEFPSLEDMMFYGGDLTDSALAHFREIPRLKSLYINNVPITDAGLVHLADMVQLRSLTLEFCPITDAGLAHLSGLTNLEWLDLTHTQITGAGLRHVTAMRLLRGLTLSECPIGDEGLRYVGKLTGLKWLSLEKTQITDTGLRELEHLEGLESLQMLGNPGTGMGVDRRLQAALPNCRISTD